MEEPQVNKDSSTVTTDGTGSRREEKSSRSVVGTKTEWTVMACQPRTWFPDSYKDCSLEITATRVNLIWKTTMTVLSIFSLFYSASLFNVPLFFFAYYSHWMAVATCIYWLLSCSNAWMLVLRPDDDQFLRRTWKALWLMMEVATHGGMGSSIGFWAAVPYFGGLDEMKRGNPLSYADVVWHGVFFFLTFADGVFINKMTYCWAHWVVCILPLALVYIVWTVVHALAIGNNPEILPNDDPYHDDAIYVNIEWKDNWKLSLVSSLGVFVGVNFFGFGFLLLMERGIRFLRAPSEDAVPDKTDEEDDQPPSECHPSQRYNP